MLLSYYQIYLKINNVIKAHGTFSDDLNKFINYYQLMIYHNYTLDDINEFERFNQSAGQNIFSKIYSDMQSLYDVKILTEQLRKYNFGYIDSYFNHTCKTFYDFLYISSGFLNSIDIKYKNFLIYLCETLNIFESNNYRQIFPILFEYIQIGINEINDRSYNGLINIIHKENFPKITIIFIAFFVYVIEIVGDQMQKRSNQGINTLKIKYVNISFIIYYFTSFSFILIIIFIFIWKINIQYKKIRALKKVFKVCNKKE